MLRVFIFIGCIFAYQKHNNLKTDGQICDMVGANFRDLVYHLLHDWAINDVRNRQSTKWWRWILDPLSLTVGIWFIWEFCYFYSL